MVKYDKKEKDKDYERTVYKYSDKDRYNQKYDKSSRMDRIRKNPDYGRYGIIK